MPKLKEALTGLPARIKAAAIERRNRGGDHRSPSLPPSSGDVTLDAVGEALAQDLPGTNWRTGSDGVLDTPWAADADLLPELLPIAITGAHAGFDGNHRTATFEAASDAQLLALGVGQADVANIRAGLERSPHHAARAIDDAFARLDPNSDTARAARRELTADNSDGDGVTITARPDGTFLVRDADGNEIGTAKDAEDVSVLAQKETPPPGASAIQSTTDGGSETTDPSNTPSGGNTISRPLEAYNRRKHYGRTPTAADRRALGAGQREVVDHYPSLVDRYYEADPSIDEPPGYMMTPDERKKSAKDRSRMARQSREDSDAQGAEKARYSKNQKRKYEL